MVMVTTPVGRSLINSGKINRYTAGCWLPLISLTVWLACTLDWAVRGGGSSVLFHTCYSCLKSECICLFSNTFFFILYTPWSIFAGCLYCGHPQNVHLCPWDIHLQLPLQIFGSLVKGFINPCNEGPSVRWVYTLGDSDGRLCQFLICFEWIFILCT